MYEYIYIFNYFDFLNYNEINFFNKLILYFTNIYYNTIIFIYIIFLNKLTFKNKFDFKIKMVMAVLILIFSTNLFEFGRECDNILFFNKNTVINEKLQNGLLIIHPLITYSSYVIFFFQKNLTHNLYNGLYFLIFKNFYLNFNFFFTAFALILGCVWSSQEVGWGGFWNWDPVELILVFFIICFISILHETDSTQSYYLNFYYFNVVGLLVYVYIILIRLDLLKSIHSFIIVESSTKLSVVFFLILFLSIFLIWFFYFKKLKMSFPFNFFLKKDFLNEVKNIFNIMNIYIIFILLMYVLYTLYNSKPIDYSVDIIYKYFVALIMVIVLTSVVGSIFYFNWFFKKFFEIHLYVYINIFVLILISFFGVVFIWLFFALNIFYLIFIFGFFFSSKKILFNFYFHIFTVFLIFFFISNNQYVFDYDMFYFLSVTDFLENLEVYINNLIFYTNVFPILFFEKKNINYIDADTVSTVLGLLNASFDVFLLNLNFQKIAIFFLDETVCFFFAGKYLLIGLFLTLLLFLILLKDCFFLKNNFFTISGVV